MGRRNDHSRDELEDMCINAARWIVQAHGLEKLTARGVAEEIGYSVGTLYNLFDGQDGLILHMNGRTLDGLRERIEQLKFTGSTEHDLLVLGRTYFAYVRRNRNLWNALFQHRLPGGLKAPRWYQTKIDNLLSVMESILAQAIPDPSDQQEAARVLWSAIHGISSLGADGKLANVTTRSAVDLMESLVVNYLRGFCASLEAK